MADKLTRYTALFGRPPIIHLRDCDVTEPLIVDDEHLTPDGVTEQSNETNETKSRLCAFVAAIRLHVILEVCSLSLVITHSNSQLMLTLHRVCWTPLPNLPLSLLPPSSPVPQLPLRVGRPRMICGKRRSSWRNGRGYCLGIGSMIVRRRIAGIQ